jgi:Fe-S cluster assembly ATP-binding protein
LDCREVLLSFGHGSHRAAMLSNFTVPGFVHVLVDGHVVKSGGKDLALELEAKGYDWILKGETLPA